MRPMRRAQSGRTGRRRRCRTSMHGPSRRLLPRRRRAARPATACGLSTRAATAGAATGERRRRQLRRGRGRSTRRRRQASCNDVYPIIAASCALAGCHDMGITTNHWTDYTTPEATYSRWVNGRGLDFCVDQPADGIYTSRVVVVPGDPMSSYLLLKIAPPTGGPLRGPDPPPAHAARADGSLPPAAIDTITSGSRTARSRIEPTCARQDAAREREVPSLVLMTGHTSTAIADVASRVKCRRWPFSDPAAVGQCSHARRAPSARRWWCPTPARGQPAR